MNKLFKQEANIKLTQRQNYIDSMKMIGKYIESYSDYVNMMKASRKFNQLTQMYHFNPFMYLIINILFLYRYCNFGLDYTHYI